LGSVPAGATVSKEARSPSPPLGRSYNLWKALENYSREQVELADMTRRGFLRRLSDWV